MGDVVSFRLYGRNGFVNTTRRISRWFFDQDTGEFREKQDARFDGGWRWFESGYDGTLRIYNTQLHKQAYAEIPDREIEEPVIDHEFVLQCAQARCLIESDYHAANADIFAALAGALLKARRELGIPWGGGL